MPIYKEVFQLQNSKDVFHLQNNIHQLQSSKIFQLLIYKDVTQLQNSNDFPVDNKDMIKMQDYKDLLVTMSEIFSISPSNVEKVWTNQVKYQMI